MKHGRQLMALLVLGGLGSPSTEGSTGYLPAIGPAALRFEEPPRRLEPPPVAPAPEPVHVTTNNVAEAATAPALPPAAGTTQIVQVPDPVSTPASALSNNPVTGLQPDSEYLPPNVLVRYFTGPGTNGVPVVVVPVGFVPPSTSPQRSSSAAYQKGP